MAFWDGMTGISDLINAGYGIANYYRQGRWQEKTWEREDNAVQRRVADLKKAGLNPVLAAGSAAQSSGPINTSQPNTKVNIANLMLMRKTFEKMDSEIQKMNAEKEKALSEKAVIDYNQNLSATKGMRNQNESNAMQIANAIISALKGQGIAGQAMAPVVEKTLEVRDEYQQKSKEAIEWSKMSHDEKIDERKKAWDELWSRFGM